MKPDFLETETLARNILLKKSMNGFVTIKDPSCQMKQITV